MEAFRGLSEEGIEKIKLEKGSSEYWTYTTGVAAIAALLVIIGAGFIWKLKIKTFK
jgi:hypothetical protein